jgi:hypothetical protein
VALHAIRSPHDKCELMLPWLLSTVDRWSQEGKNKLLNEAGTENNMFAAKLMLAEGAEWPSSFFGEQVINGESVRTSWHYKAVAWALSKGCSWVAWRCQDLASELYTDTFNHKNAKGLFKWAHENSCPCTCEASATNDAVVAA